MTVPGRTQPDHRRSQIDTYPSIGLEGEPDVRAFRSLDFQFFERRAELVRSQLQFAMPLSQASSVVRRHWRSSGLRWCRQRSLETFALVAVSDPMVDMGKAVGKCLEFVCQFRPIDLRHRHVLLKPLQELAVEASAIF